MSLDVELKIERTKLLAQENPNCQLTIVNSSRDPIVIASPDVNPDVPVLRVTEMKSGVDVLQHRHGNHLGPKYAPLPPGRKVEHEFPLTSIAQLKIAADYEISALVPYDGGLKRAE